MIERIIERSKKRNIAIELDETDEDNYVTFMVGDECYGVDVGRVSEVVGLDDITFLPNMKSYMKGLKNLRGEIIPLIDLNLRFGLAEKEYDKLTSIIVTEIKDKSIGLIVDSVLNVVNLPESEMQNTPHFSDNVEIDCISGVGKMEDVIVIILNVDKIFTDEELENI